MQIQAQVERMASFPEGLRAMLGKLPPADARWRPDAGGWSLLEIVNHLADEEVEDFRERLTRTLADPEGDWPSIDPEGVIASRGFNERDLAESLARFASAREESVALLLALEDPQWENTKQHSLGPISAGDLLASWAAHDAFHLRQIARRLYDLSRRDLPDASPAYSGGEW